MTTDLQAARKSKRYPAYKDSGVEWLGEIPAHWEVKRLKRLASLRAGAAITAESIEEIGDYPVFGGNGIRGYTSSYTHEGEFPLIGRQGALCGCVNFASGRFWSSEHAVVATPKPEVNSNWLAYLLRAMSLNSYSESAAQPGLAVESISALPVLMPAVSEQRAIAAFLDRETVKIDALATKKERLIELLREKRAALNTHAVTKGLPSMGSGQAPPTAPMKDSGVEWLGQIPAAWTVSPVRRFLVGIEQGWSPVAEDRAATDEEWGVLKLSAVAKGKFRQEEHKALPENVSPDTRYQVRSGDFLLTRANTPELVGDVCVVRVTRPGLMLSDLVYRIGFDFQQVELSFLCYWFLSVAGRYQITRDARGSSQSMVKVSGEHIRSWLTPLPPLQEQAAIALFLDRETAKLDALIAKAREGIEVLKEYRSALISAAVTGKIDVREPLAQSGQAKTTPQQVSAAT